MIIVRGVHTIMIYILRGSNTPPPWNVSFKIHNITWILNGNQNVHGTQVIMSRLEELCLQQDQLRNWSHKLSCLRLESHRPHTAISPFLTVDDAPHGP